MVDNIPSPVNVKILFVMIDGVGDLNYDSLGGKYHLLSSDILSDHL
jgi:hypothetical protein